MLPSAIKNLLNRRVSVVLLEIVLVTLVLYACIHFAFLKQNALHPVTVAEGNMCIVDGDATPVAAPPPQNKDDIYFISCGGFF